MVVYMISGGVVARISGSPEFVCKWVHGLGEQDYKECGLLKYRAIWCFDYLFGWLGFTSGRLTVTEITRS